MLTFIVFALILSFLVFIHELGHFMAARRSGVRVEEFGLGLPPKIWGKKVGETTYTLNLLPFGGFVKLTGEDDDSPDAIKRAMADPENFLSKSTYARAFILVAGILMNLLGAFILYYFVLGLNGFKSQVLPLYVDHHFKFGHEKVIQTVVSGVEPGSAAEKAGIKFGEAVIEINDTPVYTLKDVRDLMNLSTGREAKILLMDVKDSAQAKRVVMATPELLESTDGEKRGKIGIVLGPVVQIDYSGVVLLAGPLHAFNMLDYTGAVFKELVSYSFEKKTFEPVSTGISGPVGVFSIVGAILTHGGKDTVIALLDLVALLSLSLGLMNLLPIPALDGGRLVFVVFEMITKHKPDPVKEALVHKIGMAILLALMVLVTFKDVKNLIG